MNELVNNWHPEQMLEVQLKEPDDFLKVRETLTRIGVASRKDKKLFQSCHILHKQGRYFIVHCLETFEAAGGVSQGTPMLRAIGISSDIASLSKEAMAP